ncbi:cupin domain-containing protein [Xenococcus sp. PCC 7305]|uniref:hypothetical protein n=1 Tax=Xenococcus sp. PCC 7305 TaxID=102125 RepID=UPI0002ABE6D9|nr:hypothetical protein [Xenococcus sp. PCC 7305]ELS01570.1 cupin domain-containing protein [Xenococcus sp. PCC 7305]
MIQNLDLQSNSATQWDADTLYYEFSAAVAPKLPAIPCTSFDAELHQQGQTRVIPLDLSGQMQSVAPATTPLISAYFLRIREQESLKTSSPATAQMFYVLRGKGTTETEYGTIEWSKGDLFTLPSCSGLIHSASSDTAIYWVSDEALVNYLGVTATKPRFKPSLYPGDRIIAELEQIAQEPGAKKRNRIGVLFGNKETQLTRSLTHTLWALMVYLPGKSQQKPHCHNSVAIDLVVEAPESAYTLVGKSLDADGNIVNGERVYWKSGSVFVTPPGLWHSHHNDSDQNALLLPVQDAAFHSYMRTLDQRWS